MKKIKTPFLIFVFLVCFYNIKAQSFGSRIKNSWYKMVSTLKPTPWVIGVGWNMVADNGNPFKKDFKSRTWQAPAYQTTFRLEKYIDKGWSAVFYFSYNKFKKGSLINSEIPAPANSDLIAFDFNAKYNFCELYDVNQKWFKFKEKVFDLYATSGIGYTIRHTLRVKDVCTFNFGFGTNIWLYKGWGVNLQAMAKFGLTGPLIKTPTNYLQASFGVIYTFKKNRSEGTIHESLKTRVNVIKSKL
jgi:hypothetical protein